MGAIIVLKRVFAVVVEMKGGFVTAHQCVAIFFYYCSLHVFFQFKEGSNKRPRYLKQLTCSKDSPLMLSLSPPSHFDRCIVLVFIAFRVNQLILSHWLTVSKLSFNCVWIFSTHFPETKNAVSSAYRTTLLYLTRLGKSLIYDI